MIPQQAPQGGQMAAPDVSIEDFTEILESAVDPMIQQLAQNPKYMTNPMYGPLVNAELTRRVAARQQAQAQQMQQQGQQPTVVEQAQQQAEQLSPQPQQQDQLPEEQGIAQLPVGDVVSAASGGIVALAGGGLDDDYVDYDYQPELSYGDEDEILVGGTEGKANRRMSREELTPLIDSASKKYGVPAEALWRITGAESGFQTGAVDKYSGNTGGLGGVIPSTWAKYGGGKDVTDPEANIDATARIIRDNQKFLRDKLKREPNLTETYAAHWLGPGVGIALASAPADEPFDKTLQRIGGQYQDPKFREKVYAQNPKLKPDMTFGDFLTVTEQTMNRSPGKSTAAPTPAASAPAPSGRTAGLMAIMDRIDKGERVPADLDPMGYSDMNAEQRAQARRQVAAVPTPGPGTFLGIPLNTPAGQKQFEEAEQALRRNRQEQAGLTPPKVEPAPPRFTNTPTPMEPPPPPKPKAEPDYSYEENAFFGTPGRRGFDELGTGAERGQERGQERAGPQDPAKLLAEAKKTIPASERKGMSDEALLTFFLQLMGGRSRSFLRNASGAGLSALATDRALRKEEAERQKEQNLAKYYEAIAGSYNRDPEQVRIARALQADPKLMRAYQQMQSTKREMPAAQLRLQLEKQVAAELQKNPRYQYDTKAFEAERDRIVQERLREYTAGVGGGSGSGVKFLGFE
jgi:hypothetical protein